MRFGLAAFGTVLVAGIAVGLAVLGSTDSTKSSQLHVGGLWQPARPFRRPPPRSSSSEVPTVQVAHGVLTPAVRTMKPAPGHWNTMFNKVAEHSRGESVQLQDRHQGSALVQRSAPKNQMPSPIANFAGVGANGAVPPDTEGDIGPNYYMQWVNLLPDLPPRRYARDAGHARVPALHRPADLRKPTGTAATRSSSTTTSRSAGSRPSSRIRPIRTGRSTSASPTRRRVTRPAPGAPTSTSRTRRT